MAQITNAIDRKKIKDALHEISGSMTRTEAEKDLIKEIVNNLSTEFQLSKKTISKMARIYHKQNFQEEQAEYSDLEELYMNIMEETNNSVL